MTAVPHFPDNTVELLARLEDSDRVQIDRVLAQLEHHGRADPLAAATVAIRCEETALAAGWFDLVPRARYLRAQWCALEGRTQEAATLLDDAQMLFADLGMVSDALRTRLGRAHLELLEGRPQRAQDLLESLISSCRSAGDSAASIEARAEQNLGAVMIHRGTFDAAIEHLRQAREIATLLADERLVLEVTNNEAMALLRLGRAAEAIDLASSVLDAASDPDRFVVAQVRDTLGRAQLVGGELAAALTNLTSALTSFEALGLHAETGRTLVAQGDAYLTCNLTEDAFCAYTRALDEIDIDTETAGWAALGAAQAALEAGDNAGALTLGERARSTFSCVGSAVGLSQAHLKIARVERDRGNLTDATAHGRLALATAAKAAIPVECALAELFLHELDGRPERLDHVGEIVAGCHVPSLEAALQTRLGDHHRSRGDHKRAAHSYRGAISVLEHQRGSLAAERHRRLFMAGHARPYDQLQELLIADGGSPAVLEAFQLSELGRARALTDAMSGNVRVAGSERRRTIVDRHASETLRLGADGLVEDLGRPRRPVAAGPTGPDHTTTPPVELERIQRALGPSTYVAYSRLGRGLQAYVVDQSGLRRVGLVESVDDLARPVRELDAQMTRMRSDAFAHRWPDHLVEAVNRPLRTLYRLLVAPLELNRSGAGVETTVISPSAELHGIPFAALRQPDRSLIDDHAIVMTPSADAWLACRSLAPATGLSKVFAHATSRLPHVRLEGVDVARVLASRPDLAMTERARRDHALGMTTPHIVHFACHGRFRARQPMMSTLRLVDGDLTAHELATVDLQGSLVALSACESGRGAAIAGPEVLGFERAALMAGAKTAVTSRWLVHDQSARMLMRAFHAGVAAGVAPALALRDAQLELRANHPHPYHWAAFACTGAGFEPHRSAIAPRAIAS